MPGTAGRRPGAHDRRPSPPREERTLALLTWIAVGFLVLAAGFLWAGVAAFRRRRIVGGALGSLAGVLGVALAALCALLAVGTQGYRALTLEETAARVEVVPTGPREFRATFRYPDVDSARTYRLAGDQIYVDAHILKWRSVANVLGLHTAYELDRVAGRYASVEDELSGERTVHRLGTEKPVDLFLLRRAFPALAPLVDAEYGSATFVPADDTLTYEIRVSTSGLLARPVEPGG
ncbi:MAG: hypothetical protein ACOC83_05985 [Gemmatimonadota bacterium]